ncbi:predicted protein, partial [Nematostella vectensis]
ISLGTGLCASNPCTLGACMESPSGYYCICPPGYSGAGCRTQIDYCKPNPCYNSATCKGFHIEGCGGYSCVCPPNFTGKLCEKEISPCSPDVNPCVNGICKSVGGEIRCTCPGGWTGQRCETSKLTSTSHVTTTTTPNLCSYSPCQNGGTCEAHGDSYHCICPMGWYGTYCTFGK